MSSTTSQSEPVYSCTIVNLILVSATVTRHQEELPDDIDFDEQPPHVEVTAAVTNVENRDDLYLASLRMSVTLVDDRNAKLLSTHVEYNGFFEVSAPTSEDAITFLQPRVAAIISPYANQLVADLITRTGLPPLFLPPLEVFAQKQLQFTSNEPAQTIQ